MVRGDGAAVSRTTALSFPGYHTPPNLHGQDPCLPLVLYQPLSNIFFKFQALIRLHSSSASSATPVSSSSTSSIAFPRGTVAQPGPGGFILVNPPQVTMAGSFTRYPEFSGRGNDDVEQHWYLCEAIWRARQTLDAGKLIDFQTTLRERAL